LNRADEVYSFGFHPEPGSFNVVHEDAYNGTRTEKGVTFVHTSVHMDFGILCRRAHVQQSVGCGWSREAGDTEHRGSARQDETPVALHGNKDNAPVL
jgi:hypothetical protein